LRANRKLCEAISKKEIASVALLPRNDKKAFHLSVLP